MSADERDRDIPGIEAVRAAYRAARPDDAPPPRVDAAILAASRRASRRTLHGVLPPLAMAATLVLAVGLVLRITMLGPEPSPPQTIEQAPRGLESEAVRARDLTEERAAPSEDGAAPAPSSAQRAVSPPTASEPASAQRSVAPQTPPARNAPQRAAVPQAAPQAAPPQATPPTSAGERSEGLAGAALGADAGAVIPACNANFTNDPDAWLACIAAAVEVGALDRARAELAAFEAAYPDYAVPQAITTALEP